MTCAGPVPATVTQMPLPIGTLMSANSTWSCEGALVETLKVGVNWTLPVAQLAPVPYENLKVEAAVAVTCQPQTNGILPATSVTSLTVVPVVISATGCCGTLLHRT